MKSRMQTYHWSPQMAVYAAPRGALGSFYMTLIAPFRHAVVYPQMMRAANEEWPAWLDASLLSVGEATEQHS